jgi:hypothetical protein
MMTLKPNQFQVTTSISQANAIMEHVPKVVVFQWYSHIIW